MGKGVVKWARGRVGERKLLVAEEEIYEGGKLAAGSII